MHAPSGIQAKWITTDDQTDASGASGLDGEGRNVSTKLQEAPEHVRKWPAQVVGADSPWKARNEQTVPNIEADASGASGSVEGARDTSKKLQGAPQCVRKSLERVGKEYSPPEAPDKPSDHSGATATPYDTHSIHGSPDDGGNAPQVNLSTQSRRSRPRRANRQVDRAGAQWG